MDGFKVYQLQREFESNSSIATKVYRAQHPWMLADVVLSSSQEQRQADSWKKVRSGIR